VKETVLATDNFKATDNLISKMNRFRALQYLASAGVCTKVWFHLQTGLNVFNA